MQLHHFRFYGTVLILLALCSIVPGIARASAAQAAHQHAAAVPVVEAEEALDARGWTRRVVDGVRGVVDSQWHLQRAVREMRGLNPAPPSGGYNCTSNEACHHGTCVMANATEDMYGSCVCQRGYMGETCDHEQKSLKTAFLLSFLLGNIGADRLYLGYVGSGVAKLLINLFLCILPCCPLCYMCRSFTGGRQAAIAYGVTVSTVMVSTAIVWLWWIVDWTLIVTYALPDDSGYPLYDDL